MNKLSKVLNDPQSMRQISQLAAAIGGSDSGESDGENNGSTAVGNGNTNGASVSSPDITSLLGSLLSNGENGTESTNGTNNANSVPDKPKNTSENVSAPDFAKLMKIAAAVSENAKNDKNIALINALKPLLSEENRIKADRLVKIFGIMAAYPLIRESGLLGGDLFG
jgi:hypothetical protein